MADKNVIGLKFGVEGGSAIDGTSGKEILKSIKGIVSAINRSKGEAGIPGIKITADVSEASKAIDGLKKQVKEIQKGLTVTLKTKDQPSSKSSSKGSGATAKSDSDAYSKAAMTIKRYYSALSDLYKLREKGIAIDKVGDKWVSDQKGYTERIAKVNELGKALEKLGFTFKKNDGVHVPSAKTIGVNQSQKSKLKDLVSNSDVDVSVKREIAKKQTSDKTVQDDYKKRIDLIKEYFKILKEVQKISNKNSGVALGKDGSWSTSDDSYKEKIEQINQLIPLLKTLGITFEKDEKGNAKSTLELRKTTTAYSGLTDEIKDLNLEFDVFSKKTKDSTAVSFNKNAQKARQYILDNQQIASKNYEVWQLMNDVNALASSGDPKNLDELIKKYGELQAKVRETGADVESWWQKFKKGAADSFRQTVVALTTIDVRKFAQDVYQNIVRLDEALVDIQIATGKTREEVKALMKEHSNFAKQLGATTAEIAEAADAWLRQGYSMKESEQLIRNSMMLSKLGKVEAAEATTYLTSAMKGYNISVDDSIKVVDKLSATDMVAAASAGDIATAMSETATSANIAGVSMDKLIGYLTVVKEVTQDGSESVGNFAKTMFARMGKVQAGANTDDEGESLNDVETVLKSLDISLKNSEGRFRSFEVVLDEVAAKWKEYDNVQRHQIATAMAGKLVPGRTEMCA